ncbi:MAG: hypothetical protein EWV76_02145 [Microcystis novacekii Mn_MB_F_20050700_S1]|uniref:Uncharacterized protein n=1 Tax=Microcystis novacekii Mn_MB_F_20050700_S1D TaxID=2486266 RepID=A0A552J1Z5_9CHRO|nr:MAG: hypothetical protein EWV54_08255 [Microcystis novacekii Mn_MB_F_20050700_S1D]TRU92441.1 MAG: hypothetical protein EWV76_02145 [Microcystis novacekii Mn_MB_F_20050700_S1]
MENNLLAHHSGDSETGDRRQEIIFIYSSHTPHPTPYTPHPHPTSHTPLPTPHTPKKRNWEKKI